jgi:hypothetical protein
MVTITPPEAERLSSTTPEMSSATPTITPATSPAFVTMSAF